MSKLKRAYFARCMSEYGTEGEEQIIKRIRGLGFHVIEFPSEADCNAGKENGDNIMETLFKPLVQSADVLFWLSVDRNCGITAGVYKEIGYAFDVCIPIFEVSRRWWDRPHYSIEETREYIKACKTAGVQ